MATHGSRQDAVGQTFTVSNRIISPHSSDGVTPSDFSFHPSPSSRPSNASPQSPNPHDDFLRRKVISTSSLHSAVSLEQVEQIIRADPSVVVKDLRRLFRLYCTFGKSRENAMRQSPEGCHSPIRSPTRNVLNNHQFAKLVRESHLVDGTHLNATAVDLVFTQATTKGERRMTFQQFMFALGLIAELKGLRPETIAGMLVRLSAMGGPQYSRITSVDEVRLFDDKSTYTGVHAHHDAQHPVLFRDRVRSSPVPPVDREETEHRADEEQEPEGSEDEEAGCFEDGQGDVAQPQWVFDKLQQLFLSYCSFGESRGAKFRSPEGCHRGYTYSGQRSLSGCLDGRKFEKLLREAGLVDAAFDASRADLVFHRAKPSGGKGRCMDFRRFVGALSMVAEAKGLPPEAVTGALLQAAELGPQFSSTTAAAAVRLHDDKSTYTGMYRNGDSPGAETRPRTSKHAAKFDRDKDPLSLLFQGAESVGGALSYPISDDENARCHQIWSIVGIIEAGESSVCSMSVADLEHSDRGAGTSTTSTREYASSSSGRWRAPSTSSTSSRLGEHGNSIISVDTFCGSTASRHSNEYFSGDEASSVDYQDLSRLSEDRCSSSEDEDIRRLKRLFNSYCIFGLTRSQLTLEFGSSRGKRKKLRMDGGRFAKLCRECGLLDKKCNLACIDLIFTKAKRRGERLIDFNQFLGTLNLIAAVKGKSPVEVAERLLDCGVEPQVHDTTTPEDVRFYHLD